MTTAAIILGVLPWVFATGAGSVARRQMGIVLIGGMSCGPLLLTLFVAPTAYCLLTSRKR